MQLESYYTFKLSGSSDRPAYPGFIVMATKQVGFSVNVVPSNTNVFILEITALCTDNICHTKPIIRAVIYLLKNSLAVKKVRPSLKWPV